MRALHEGKDFCLLCPLLRPSTWHGAWHIGVPDCVCEINAKSSHRQWVVASVWHVPWFLRFATIMQR